VERLYPAASIYLSSTPARIQLQLQLNLNPAQLSEREADAEAETEGLVVSFVVLVPAGASVSQLGSSSDGTHRIQPNNV